MRLCSSNSTGLIVGEDKLIKMLMAVKKELYGHQVASQDVPTLVDCLIIAMNKMALNTKCLLL